MNGRKGEGNENTNKILPHKDSIYMCVCVCVCLYIYIYIYIYGKEVKTMGSIIKTPS